MLILIIIIIFSYFQFFPKLYIIICKPHQNDRRFSASFSCRHSNHWEVQGLWPRFPPVQIGPNKVVEKLIGWNILIDWYRLISLSKKSCALNIHKNRLSSGRCLIDCLMMIRFILVESFTKSNNLILLILFSILFTISFQFLHHIRFRCALPYWPGRSFGSFEQVLLILLFSLLLNRFFSFFFSVFFWPKEDWFFLFFFSFLLFLLHKNPFFKGRLPLTSPYLLSLFRASNFKIFHKTFIASTFSFSEQATVVSRSPTLGKLCVALSSELAI